jgi:exopolyphosphatase/guanosine-5'-triphosphate,3'-diphosphate pyrophosphatase
MRFAIIDLGTNTFNLLIAEKSGESWQHVFNTKIPVKLGEGGMNDSKITDAAFQRGIDAMENLRETMRNWSVEKHHAFATSAIRSSSNGLEFVEAVREKTGISVEVIDGDREAELIHKGVVQTNWLSEKVDLILDIGGGSSELILATQDEVLWKKSFDLGVSRLIERLNPSNPVSKEDIQNLESTLTEELTPLFEAVKKVEIHSLIGCSGSFDSVVEMIAARDNQKAEVNVMSEHHEIENEDFEWLYQTLLPTTIEERLHFPGLVEMRAEMIVFSLIIIRFLLNDLEIKNIRHSAYALKEGALFDLMNE